MFSVIIPLYNKDPYVEKAIQSVLAQTFREFELIVVDDGSTDNGFEIVKQYCENRKDVMPYVSIVQQPNQGVSTARNNGVKQAKYPYVCFLDADDWWEPTFLEEMKALIESYPDAGIYGSSYYKVKDTKHIPANIGVEEGFVKGYINYCKVYAKTLWMPLWTGVVIIPKQVYEAEKGFKPQLKLGEDFDLWIRIALKHKVALLNKPLAYYNQDVEQASRSVVFNKIYEPETHFIFNLDYLSEEERKNKNLKLLLDRLRVYTLLRYRLQKKYQKEYLCEINKVDFNQFSLSIKLNYSLPVFVLKLKTRLVRLLKAVMK